MRYLKLSILLFVSVLFFSGCQNSPMSELFAPGKDAIDSAKTATVADFVTSYRQNSAKANSDYAGKWVKIRGKVTSINGYKGMQGTNQTDYYMVGLKDDTGKTNGTITCRFNFNKANELRALQAGQTATFYGIIDKVDSVTQMPMITDCQIVK